MLLLRKQIGEEMAEEVLARMEGRVSVPGPGCPKCGKEVHYMGQRAKDVESQAGELTLERGYYACPDCEEGLFPPG